MFRRTETNLKKPQTSKRIGNISRRCQLILNDSSTSRSKHAKRREQRPSSSTLPDQNRVFDVADSLNRQGLDLVAYGDPNAISSNHYLELEKRFRLRMLHHHSLSSPATLTDLRFKDQMTHESTTNEHVSMTTSTSEKAITTPSRKSTKRQGSTPCCLSPTFQATKRIERKGDSTKERGKSSEIELQVLFNSLTYSEVQLKKDMFYWRQQALGK
jgi:hypothetical protein